MVKKKRKRKGYEDLLYKKTRPAYSEDVLKIKDDLSNITKLNTLLPCRDIDNSHEQIKLLNRNESMETEVIIKR